MKGRQGPEIPQTVVIAPDGGAHTADFVPPETSSDYFGGPGVVLAVLTAAEPGGAEFEENLARLRAGGAIQSFTAVTEPSDRPDAPGHVDAEGSKPGPFWV
ncbi:hypothetical protein ACX80W_11315 [Arthrobacter sp. TMN-37]